MSRIFRRPVLRRTCGCRASTWTGNNRSYVLHHRTPIQHGGGVYDVDNILIVTPKYHLDVLDRAYHF
ncbi:HNH endonuclease signature motif containing protein [Pantoea cypripedii]|uniref:HNH endonuclease signature motif containing protein n=1 Tax=Pantoea cypripedii TaxID=55209 RepID=UPI003F6DAA78